jgi:hypothetical protein
LGAALLFATFDNIPDPPAAGPGSTQLEAFCVHQNLASTPATCSQTAIPLVHFSEAGAIPDGLKLLPERGLPVSTEQAADPSPPFSAVLVGS